MSTANIIKTLWGATNPNKLSNEQLKALSCSEELSLNLTNIADIMNGIAALVADDEKVGCLQGKNDVPQMLWGFKSAIESIAEAVFISSEAQAMLIGRLQNEMKEGNPVGAKQ